MGIFVFWMQAGFALVEAGSVRVKNTKNILIKNVFDASIAASFWWWFGYGVAFGKDDFASNGNNGFLGTSGYFYEGDSGSPLTMSSEGKGRGKAFFLFQWAFAGALRRPLFRRGCATSSSAGARLVPRRVTHSSTSVF